MIESTIHNAWEPYESDKAAPWNLERVVHLHRRAVFGGTWSEIQRDLNDGPEKAVNRILEGQVRSSGVPEGFEKLADVIGDAAVSSENADRLEAWWMFRFLHSSDPLSERLALMWHNHFATSQEKVKNLPAMREQNEIFRKFGRASFRELLPRVVKQPAILIWLDADTNRKGHPNENLSRELMELFTLGEGHYSERDVQEAARALTGWTVKRGKFHKVPESHDSGPKTIIGVPEIEDGDGLLQRLLQHPATSRRLAWRLCQTFFGEDVATEANIDELAAQLRDSQLDIGKAVETILRSRLFFSEKNIGNRVTGPVEYVVGAVRRLELLDPSPSTLLLAEWSARMEQDLFHPPNVFGWDEGRSWINSRTLISRTNFIHALCRGECHIPRVDFDPRTLLDKADTPATEFHLRSLMEQLLFGKSPVTAKAPDREKHLSRERAVEIVSELLSAPRAQLG